MKVKEMCICAFFTVLIAVGAFIKLPISIVPVTLQTLFVIMAGLFLKKKAVYSVLLYIVMGLIGLPVFASGGGPGYVLMPSFGYLIGFVVCTLVLGMRKDDRYLLVKCIISMLIIYLIGVAYFAGIEYFYYQQVFGIEYLLVQLFLVYIPGDIISILAAILVYRQLKDKVVIYDKRYV
jgi:biotin transport system substrate-specific component